MRKDSRTGRRRGLASGVIEVAAFLETGGSSGPSRGAFALNCGSLNRAGGRRRFFFLPFGGGGLSAGWSSFLISLGTPVVVPMYDRAKYFRK